MLKKMEKFYIHLNHKKCLLAENSTLLFFFKEVHVQIVCVWCMCLGRKSRTHFSFVVPLFTLLDDRRTCPEMRCVPTWVWEVA